MPIPRMSRSGQVAVIGHSTKLSSTAPTSSMMPPAEANSTCASRPISAPFSEIMVLPCGSSTWPMVAPDLGIDDLAGRLHRPQHGSEEKPDDEAGHGFLQQEACPGECAEARRLDRSVQEIGDAAERQDEAVAAPSPASCPAKRVVPARRRNRSVPRTGRRPATDPSTRRPGSSTHHPREAREYRVGKAIERACPAATPSRKA